MRNEMQHNRCSCSQNQSQAEVQMLRYEPAKPSLQLYDADTDAKLGNEIRVKSDSGDGTVAGGAFSFVVPFAKPQRLTAAVIADAGATRSPPSDRSELVVAGKLSWQWRRCALAPSLAERPALLEGQFRVDNACVRVPFVPVQRAIH